MGQSILILSITVMMKVKNQTQPIIIIKLNIMDTVLMVTKILYMIFLVIQICLTQVIIKQNFLNQTVLKVIIKSPTLYGRD